MCTNLMTLGGPLLVFWHMLSEVSNIVCSGAYSSWYRFMSVSLLCELCWSSFLLHVSGGVLLWL